MHAITVWVAPYRRPRRQMSPDFCKSGTALSHRSEGLLGSLGKFFGATEWTRPLFLPARWVLLERSRRVGICTVAVWEPNLRSNRKSYFNDEAADARLVD
jgi:hypothetical protein